MFEDDKIAGIEQHYNAAYVIDACLKSTNGFWVDFPAAIFYTEKAHPEGSNYFAYYWSENDGWMITNGFNAVQGVFNGFVFEDGELVHSRYRHDYFEHRGAMVDGGRDYVRSSACPEGAKAIRFQVVNGEIKQVIDFEYDTGRIIE
jgi:hypothetical protein